MPLLLACISLAEESKKGVKDLSPEGFSAWLEQAGPQHSIVQLIGAMSYISNEDARKAAKEKKGIKDSESEKRQIAAFGPSRGRSTINRFSHSISGTH